MCIASQRTFGEMAISAYLCYLGYIQKDIMFLIKLWEQHLLRFRVGLPNCQERTKKNSKILEIKKRNCFERISCCWPRIFTVVWEVWNLSLFQFGPRNWVRFSTKHLPNAVASYRYISFWSFLYSWLRSKMNLEKLLTFTSLGFPWVRKPNCSRSALFETICFSFDASGPLGCPTTPQLHPPGQAFEAKVSDINCKQSNSKLACNMLFTKCVFLFSFVN